MSTNIATNWRLVLEIEDDDMFLDEFNLYHSEHSTGLEECYIPKKKGTVIGYARYSYFTRRSTVKACFVGRIVECTTLNTEQEIFDLLDEVIPSEVGDEYIQGECVSKFHISVSQVVDPKIRDAPFISDD